MSGPMRYWNFCTGQNDYRTLVGADAEAVRQYIPQEPACLGLFDGYIGRGDAPMDAMRQVLAAVLDLPEELHVPEDAE